MPENNSVNIVNIGLGCSTFNLAVYLANTLNMSEYNKLDTIYPLVSGEITSIGLACGNGWRKVFNVYSKLLYELDPTYFPYRCLAPTWRLYRDNFLLQQGSGTALLFTPPILNKSDDCIHIIMGKTYAKELINSGKLRSSLIWLDEQFAIDVNSKVIVCPYFDYRQLSNNKIVRLAGLMRGLLNESA
ncbi:DUF6942 family protein [Psychromonas sp. KJ10-10]|uniref:DUF6942 family protein n=1 Tax=Psychromonas sp. KJ10-10 TaxID=3391823 RepID=UPI0039B69D7F